MAYTIEQYKKEVKKVVKEQYKNLGIAKIVEHRKKEYGETYCGELAQMLADSCTDILHGTLNLGTQEEWDILEAEIDKYMPPEG